MNDALPTVVVLGASGLIGEAIVTALQRDGFSTAPVARRFTVSQRNSFGQSAVKCPIVDLATSELAALLRSLKADMVVNCIGVLQDSGRGDTDDVHRAFVGRIVDALTQQDRPPLLFHLSIPGRDDEDLTSFSRTKREAERIITAGPIPFVIIRPGFVLAPAAYGGSALIRALAALPVDLPARETATPFSITAMSDITATVAAVAKKWGNEERHANAIWDVMASEPTTLGDVIDGFRRHLGSGNRRLRLPAWMLDLGARAGDVTAFLGWSPPIRSTALTELRRGVGGDPGPWINATGIRPEPLAKALQVLPAGIQEKWFARLYLIKPLLIFALAIFWTVSGLIALTLAFDEATAILTSHGITLGMAKAITVISSLTDIAIGLAIAVKKSCRFGLLVGIAVSFFYLAGAAIITPDLWIEPLGALVKTIPALVLMAAGLAILDDR